MRLGSVGLGSSTVTCEAGLEITAAVREDDIVKYRI
jgi:hypothetical protein